MSTVASDPASCPVDPPPVAPPPVAPPQLGPQVEPPPVELPPPEELLDDDRVRPQRPSWHETDIAQSGQEHHDPDSGRRAFTASLYFRTEALLIAAFAQQKSHTFVGQESRNNTTPLQSESELQVRSNPVKPRHWSPPQPWAASTDAINIGASTLAVVRRRRGISTSTRGNCIWRVQELPPAERRLARSGHP